VEPLLEELGKLKLAGNNVNVLIGMDGECRLVEESCPNIVLKNMYCGRAVPDNAWENVTA
jgi:hypothetical protein